jgi:crossover junction endodeoxyribonuclease RuvC
VKIFALDLSLTSTGWARNYGPAPLRGTYTPRGKGVPRLADVVRWLARQLLQLGEPDLVVIEGYSYASVHVAHQLGELGGTVRLYLYSKGLRFVDVAPGTLKKVATGKGNSAKEKVLAEAIRRLEYSGSDHNEADALWLLQAALYWYRLPGCVDLPKAHVGTLGKVDWPELEELESEAA